MITFYPNDIEKVRVLDELLRYISINDLKELVSKDLIVAKLKNNQVPHENGAGPFEQLLIDYNQKCVNLQMVESQLITLKFDIQAMIRIMTRPIDQQSVHDLQGLKSRHGIY